MPEDREGGIRVPLIARCPGTVPAGAVSSFPCASWDFFPTFAELAGAAPPRSLDGVSIVPALRAEARERTRPLYWEAGGRGGLRRAVRMGHWKAVRNAPDEPLELYNLEQDIGEQTDVASENPEVMARMRSYLAICRTDPPELREPGWKWPP